MKKIEVDLDALPTRQTFVDCGTAKIVYADFARQIRAAKQRGDGFDAIDVGADAVEVDVLEGIVYQFPKLRSEEIRALADRVFEEKYAARVKE